MQIKCEGVDYTSSTYDPFLDLSLEINKASSLQRALNHFTAPEILDGDNRLAPIRLSIELLLLLLRTVFPC